MSAAQKHAWFTVVVVGLSIIAMGVLVPWLGFHRATGGASVLGLLGLGPLFYRKRPGQVVVDERDAAIQRRSLLITAAVFWVVLVEACVFLPWFYYGAEGAVPVWVVQSSVLVAWIIVSLIYSAATLVQYGRGGSDAA
jgi:hypothetical protein